MADRAIAYDLMTETAHQLNATAGELLEACDGEGDVDAAIEYWAISSGVDREVVGTDVDAAVAMFEELGLVGRDEEFVPPMPPVGCLAPAAADAVLGEVHPVIDYNIAFRSPQPELLATLDAFLGTGTEGLEPTMVFDVHEEPSGEVVLVTDYEWKFPSLQACLNQLTMVMNEYAVWTHSCVALHAGAVRSPEGEILLMPAESGGGKSTLTGAFIAAGWDYLGDEAIGVKPGSLNAVGYPKRLAIDASSRMVLGLALSDDGDLDPAELRQDVVRLSGEADPVSRVVLPTFVQGAAAALEPLEPEEAVVELLANSLNLARATQSALAALCDLAASVPVHRLIHGDAHQGATLVEAWLMESGRSR